MGDNPDAETSYRTTHNTHGGQIFMTRWDSNPQSQKANCLISKLSTTWPLIGLMEHMKKICFWNTALRNVKLWTLSGSLMVAFGGEILYRQK